MARLLDNWLLAYSEYTQGNESPESFHFWTGVVTIAAAAQRKIYLPLGHHLTIHSNFLVVLTGPSGGPRKSKALNIGKSLLVKTEEYGLKAHIAPKKASSAAIISRMAAIHDAEHQSITAYSGELGTLLGAQSVDISDIITDLWDCDPNFDKDTIARGAEKITAPWLNIIAATTPIWLADNLPKTAVEGGFVSRGLYIYEEDKAQRVAIPRTTPEQAALEPKLIHDLAQIMKLEGAFHFDSEVTEHHYEEWYNDTDNFKPKYGNRMETYYERKQDHVLKTAMIMSLARGDSLLLEWRDIAAAIGVVEQVEKSMGHAFQGVGRNALSMDQERIHRQIMESAERGVPYKAILAKHIHAIDKSNIDIILMTLREMGVIHMDGSIYRDMRLKGVVGV